MQVFGSSYCNYRDFKFSFDAKKKNNKINNNNNNNNNNFIKSSSEWVGKKLKIEK